MASINNIKLFSDAWIWNSANSRHICHNQKLFTVLSSLKNQLPIQDLADTMMSQDIEQVDLKYNNGNGGIENLCLKEVFYMLGIGINLISQRQIH